MGNKKLIQEDLDRFNKILSYNTSKGNHKPLLSEGMFDFLKKFTSKKEDIKTELYTEFNIEEGDTKEEIEEKIKNNLGGEIDESKLKKIGGSLGNLLLTTLSVYLTYKSVINSPFGDSGSLPEFLAYGIASYMTWSFLDNDRDTNRD